MVPVLNCIKCYCAFGAMALRPRTKNDAPIGSTINP